MDKIMWITLPEVIPLGSAGWHEGGNCTEYIELLNLLSRGRSD